MLNARALKWLFLDMNSFFASVEQQLRPELRGQPVGVVPVMADSSCCIAASYEAKGHGIKTGTRISDAKERCPGIRLVQARPAEYVRVHEAIVRAVDSVLPEPESQRRTVGHSHVLSPQYRTQQGARAVMVKLIHKAAARLRKLGYFSGEISIALRYPRQDNWHIKQVMEPCQDTQSLLKIFDGLWKQRPTSMAPLSVSITLHKLVPESAMSLPLFPEDRHRQDLGKLMDQINTKFGPQSIYTATMQEAAQTAPMRISFTKIPDITVEADRE